MAVLFVDTFESGSIAANWDSGNGTVTTAQAQGGIRSYELSVATAGTSKGLSLSGGLTGGGNNSHDQFYAQWYVYFKSDYDFQAVAGKYAELLEAKGDGGVNTFRLRLQYSNQDQEVRFYWFGNTPTVPYVEWIQTASSFTMAKSQWHKIEVYAQLNTSGVADGIIRLKINDVQIINSTNRDYRGTATTKKWDDIYLEHNYNYTLDPSVAAVLYVDSWDLRDTENTGGSDTTPPVISAISSGSPGATSATITWSTDEGATSQVDYGLTTSYGSSTTKDLTLLTSHSQGLTGLTPSTLYNYRVKSEDAVTNASTSSNNTFTTAADTTAPTLSNVASSGITVSSANITWTTNELADSQVDYGLTGSYGNSTTLQTTLATSHSHSITGLSPNTTYHYRVKSRDAASNLATGSDNTFMTTATDTTAPSIFNIRTTNVSASSVEILWDTDEVSTSIVDYGLTNAYGTTTTENTNLVLAHSVIITGLSGSTTYHYRVKSKDLALNLGVSSDQTFDTLPVQVGTSRQIIFAIDPFMTDEQEAIANTYTWPDVSDFNSDAQAFSCAYVPKTKGTSINHLQDTLFLGTFNVGKILHTFRSDLAQDGGQTLTAEAITNNLDPTLFEEEHTMKRFVQIEFPFVNSMTEGLTIEFIKDTVDPHAVSVAWVSTIWSSGKSFVTIPSGLGRWINLRIRDTTNKVGKVVFSGFLLHYLSLNNRENRNT